MNAETMHIWYTIIQNYYRIIQNYLKCFEEHYSFTYILSFALHVVFFSFHQERERETERQTKRERETDKERERDRDRQRERPQQQSLHSAQFNQSHILTFSRRWSCSWHYRGRHSSGSWTAGTVRRSPRYGGYHWALRAPSPWNPHCLVWIARDNAPPGWSRIVLSSS